MSSTSKTPHYNLNQWIGTDIPKMEDFNRDNALMDSTVYTHHANASIHTSDTERSKWNNPYYMTTYFGNGSSSRTITLSCDFEPSWGIIFAVGKLPSVTDFPNESDYNYFGLVSANGTTLGLGLSANRLTVLQNATPILGHEYRNFNENGVTYVVIMFR